MGGLSGNCFSIEMNFAIIGLSTRRQTDTQSGSLASAHNPECRVWVRALGDGPEQSFKGALTHHTKTVSWRHCVSMSVVVWCYTCLLYNNLKATMRTHHPPTHHSLHIHPNEQERRGDINYAVDKQLKQKKNKKTLTKKGGLIDTMELMYVAQGKELLLSRSSSGGRSLEVEEEVAFWTTRRYGWDEVRLLCCFSRLCRCVRTYMKGEKRCLWWVCK